MAYILVAPQEFKGSLTAREAAEAIERGILRAAPDAAVDRCPLSDGGPGFVELLSEQLPGRLEEARARDPLGRWRAAQLLVTDDRVVFLEAAQANGLALLREAERDPTKTDTAGVGDLLLAAARYRPRRIVVGVGGSATNDGGAGMARALGARFLDDEGEELPNGVLHLRRLARIEWRRPEAFAAADVLVAADVDSPLLGPRGATFVFAPQKGARTDQLPLLEAALRRYAAVVERDLGVPIANVPGAGAAGGLAAGLVAFLGARIVSGFDVVAEAVGLGRRVAKASAVVTGEGSFDEQSLAGKVTGRLIQLAEAHGRPWTVLTGRASGRLRARFGDRVRTLEEVEADERRRLEAAASLLEELARRWAATNLSR